MILRTIICCCADDPGCHTVCPFSSHAVDFLIGSPSSPNMPIHFISYLETTTVVTGSQIVDDTELRPNNRHKCSYSIRFTRVLFCVVIGNGWWDWLSSMVLTLTALRLGHRSCIYVYYLYIHIYIRERERESYTSHVSSQQLNFLLSPNICSINLGDLRAQDGTGRDVGKRSIELWAFGTWLHPRWSDQGCLRGIYRHAPLPLLRWEKDKTNARGGGG